MSKHWKIVRLNNPQSILAKLAYAICLRNDVQLVYAIAELYGKKCIVTAFSKLLDVHENSDGSITQAASFDSCGYGADLREACANTLLSWHYENFGKKPSSVEEMAIDLATRGVKFDE